VVFQSIECAEPTFLELGVGGPEGLEELAAISLLTVIV
jgi:hypothetical protein